MGRQLSFYITNRDISDLIVIIHSKGGIIINEDGTVLSEEDLRHLMDIEYMKEKFQFFSWYIKLEKSELHFNYSENIDRKHIEFMRSDVIQFLVPRSLDSQINTFLEGRFWYSTSNYDKNGNAIQRTLMKSLFDALQRYIKKNYVKDISKFSMYMGPDCYLKYKSGEYHPRVNGGALPVYF